LNRLIWVSAAAEVDGFAGFFDHERLIFLCFIDLHMIGGWPVFRVSMKMSDAVLAALAAE
jgi:hypothetical protein